MIIDLSNYRLKEDICVETPEYDPTPAGAPVIKMSDVIIGGKVIAELMAHTTNNEPEYNTKTFPGVQHCRYQLLPEEIGLTSYYEIYQALLAIFGTTEEELLANDRLMNFPISSVKLGDTVFNAINVAVSIRASYLKAMIIGQTFTIELDLYFKNPNLVSSASTGEWTSEQSFAIDIIR